VSYDEVIYYEEFFVIVHNCGGPKVPPLLSTAGNSVRPAGADEMSQLKQ
jgi:hypothetical protein